MDYIFVIGGVALTAIIVLALYKAYCSKNNSEPVSISDLVNDMADEQLVVDHLDAHDLTTWFRSKNVDGKQKNILIYPNETNLKSFKLPAGIDLDGDKTIIQALLDNDDNIVLCRSVVFASMNAKLEQLFNENDGVIIVE